MIKVRLSETYNNWYWNSATGVTIKKEDREGIMVNENDKIVRMALDQGVLEMVSDEESMKQKEIREIKESKPEIKPEKTKIMNTGLNSTNFLKEVVTPENSKHMNKMKEESSNATTNTNTSNKEY